MARFGCGGSQTHLKRAAVFGRVREGQVREGRLRERQLEKTVEESKGRDNFSNVFADRQVVSRSTGLVGESPLFQSSNGSDIAERPRRA